MIKKATKTDLLFILSLIVGILSLSIFLFTYPHFYDETFYATIPYRLATGDSLIQHEWHLSQFASLFSYLPVRIWLSLKGSTDGIFVFLRFVYFIIHIATTVIVYRFFRKYEKWAIVAAMLFFTQMPYRMFSISYNSVYVIFTLFMILCILSIYKKKSKQLYILAGICFSCCCISNPLYCFAFVFYLLMCCIWKKRETFKVFVIKIKTWYILKAQKNIHQKQRKKTQQTDAFPDMESYNCFFSKEAAIYSFCGILITAIVAVAFFFATGGTINSVLKNIPNLLNSSEYTIISSSVLFKIKDALYYLNKISLNMLFIPILLYLFLLFDRRNKENSHRLIYLITSLVIAIVFMWRMFKIQDNVCFFSLPFAFFSSVCYILTNKKNKILFHCMWIPGLIAAIFKYMSANTLLASLGIVLAINNIAGVFFVRDLFIEIEEKLNKKHKSGKTDNDIIKSLLCMGICIQFIFHGFVFLYGQLPGRNSVKATVGPYSGIIMTEQQYDTYNNLLSDLEVIKKYNTESDPILIISYQNWMHMYTGAPIATYTTWRHNLKEESLSAYYKENPERIPRYIYIDSHNYFNEYDSYTLDSSMDIISNMFKFSKEDLSNGVLLTVENVKFETQNYYETPTIET